MHILRAVVTEVGEVEAAVAQKANGCAGSVLSSKSARETAESSRMLVELRSPAIIT